MLRECVRRVVVAMKKLYDGEGTETYLFRSYDHQRRYRQRNTEPALMELNPGDANEVRIWEAGLATASTRRTDQLDAHLSAWTAERSDEEVMRLLQGVGVPAGRIVANQEIGARGHRVYALHRDIGTRAGEAHAELRAVNLIDDPINGKSGA